jgi:lysophospholipase L1-like esterase
VKRQKQCNKHYFWKEIGNIVILVGLLLLVGVGLADAEDILGFGDSITQGFPFIKNAQDGSTQGGYEPVLSGLLASVGRISVVFNYGHGAENTAWGLNRIDSVIAAHPGAVMLILEGTNDKEYGLSMNTTIANLNAMMDKCRSNNVTPVIGTITPNDAWHNPSDIPNYYNPAIINLAADKGVMVADQYSTIASNWSNLKYDKTHLNQSGYDTMASVWFNALQSAQPAKPVPSVLYTSATNMAETSVTLNADVNPNGDPTTCYFEYGLASVGYDSKSVVFDAGSGYYSQRISTNLTGLKPSSTYNYRMVAQNSRGTKESGNAQFTTSQASSPYASTLDANNVTRSDATLNAIINPYGFSVSYYFEYGVSTAYGAQTKAYDLPASNDEQSVSVTIGELDKETTYHFRVVVKYNSSVIDGGDRSLITESGGGGGGGGCFISSVMP